MDRCQLQDLPRRAALTQGPAPWSRPGVRCLAGHSMRLQGAPGRSTAAQAAASSATTPEQVTWHEDTRGSG